MNTSGVIYNNTVIVKKENTELWKILKTFISNLVVFQFN